MEFSILAALVAGFGATIVMSAMMRMASAAGMTRMPPMPLVTGAMFSGDRDTATRIGLAVHYVAMGTVVFGLIYAGILSAVGAGAILTGVLVGLVHGLVVGVAMAMMPAMHPRMGAVPAAVGGGSVTEEGGEVRLTAPGLFGTRWGAMTPAGLVVGHVVYGLVFALLYQALV